MLYNHCEVAVHARVSGVIATIADPDFPASTAEVAVTVTVAGVVLIGVKNSPDGLTAPAEADQLTAAL
jgi:hypothetical protein